MATTSIVSLNQLITWFENFQENHYILKDFGFGETYDIGTSRQMTFPYMWITLNDDNNIATGSNVKSAIPDISFSIMFMDKINIQPNYLDQNGFQSDNSQEILSDMVQCLQDLITEIQQNWGQYGVLLSQDVSFFPVIDDTPDKATGVIGRFVIRTRQVNCVNPVYCAKVPLHIKLIDVGLPAANVIGFAGDVPLVPLVPELPEVPLVPDVPLVPPPPVNPVTDIDELLRVVKVKVEPVNVPPVYA